MNEYDLAVPKRQSILGVAVIFFKNLRTAINIFISLIAVSFGLQFSLLGLDLMDLAVVVVVIFMIISYFQYRRFFFYVVDDKFIIEKGLFSRDKVTIPFDRIQTVNITQNLIQQLLKVVAVKIDTAGSAQRELEISALERSYARELQNFLIERKGNTEVESGEQVTKTDYNEDPNLVIADSSAPLVSLSLRQLLLVGLTENHLRTVLVVFAVLNGYFWQYEEYLLKPIEPMIQEGANYVLARWLILLPIGVIMFIAIAVAISVIQVLLKYYNLRFFVNEKGVQLTSGLLKRNEYQVPVKKIQYIKWNSNPLRKILGIRTLLVKKAASEELGDRHGIKVPGCTEDQINKVLDQFYPERKVGGFYLLKAHKLLFLQLGTWLGAVPALALLALMFLHPALAVVGVAYLFVALFFVFQYYKRLDMAINEHVVVLRKGWVYPGYKIFKISKLQDVSFHQSFFQRRRGLASLRFYTAAGDARMLHIPREEALEIYNYALFRIETHKGGWM